MTDLWWYQAAVERVVDGDTLILRMDAGFRITTTHSVRLLGVDTPEVRGEEREAGLAAKEYVVGWVETHSHSEPEDPWPFRVRTEKADSFGRYLGTLQCHGCSADLVTDLIADGQGEQR